MMKRLFAAILALTMALSLAACGGNEENTDTNEAETIVIGSAEELLNAAWDKLSDDNKFPVMGGDTEHMTDGAAGSFGLEDAESVESFLHISADTTAKLSSAASLIHAMNANTFTAFAAEIAEGQDSEAVVESIKAEIMDTQWMCGFPELLRIYTIGGYAVCIFGNSEVMSVFTEALEGVYGQNAVLSAEEQLG